MGAMEGNEKTSAKVIPRCSERRCGCGTRNSKKDEGEIPVLDSVDDAGTVSANMRRTVRRN